MPPASVLPLAELLQPQRVHLSQAGDGLRRLSASLAVAQKSLLRRDQRARVIDLAAKAIVGL